MLHLKKCVIAFLLIVLCCTPAVYADNEIDMNLTNPSSTSANTEVTSNATANENTLVNGTSNLNGTTVSSVPNDAKTELGITGIINILLITVGVILIFLAIAILIRLK